MNVLKFQVKPKNKQINSNRIKIGHLHFANEQIFIYHSHSMYTHTSILHEAKIQLKYILQQTYAVQLRNYTNQQRAFRSYGKQYAPYKRAIQCTQTFIYMRQADHHCNSCMHNHSSRAVHFRIAFHFLIFFDRCANIMYIAIMSTLIIFTNEIHQNECANTKSEKKICIFMQSINKKIKQQQHQKRNGKLSPHTFGVAIHTTVKYDAHIHTHHGILIGLKPFN